MTEAFRATYSDWKLVKTRQVVQIVFEVPLHDSGVAYEVLGGMPNNAQEQWFGIAAIRNEKEVTHTPRLDAPKPTAGEKRDWRELQPQQQAGIRCSEPTFIAFLKEMKSDDWHESEDAASCVRLICGVHSRVELGTDHRARVAWHALDQEYQAWKVAEHA